MEKAKDEIAKKQPAWALMGLEVEKNPVTTEEKSMQAYVWIYGRRKIWLENGTLFYQQEGPPKYKLIPMGKDTFMLEGLDYFRMKFNKDRSGKVVEPVGMYNNGETDSNTRNDK